MSDSKTFPQAPAPVIGVQRRRALCAVTSVKVILDEVGAAFAEGADWLHDNIAAAMKWQGKACEETIRGIPLSAGARRDLDSQLAVLARLVYEGRSKDGDAALRHWSALLVAVSALVVDATATARAVTNRKVCWQKMQEAMDTIAEGVTESVPGCDIDGTAMYMEISR